MKKFHLIIVFMGLFFSYMIMANENNYQHQLKLQLNKDKAAFVLEVPETIYQNVYYPYLSDIRIANASGDLVPMRIVLSSDQIEHKYSKTTLPTFKLNKATSLPKNTKQKRTTRSGSHEDYTVETSQSMRYFIVSQEKVDNTSLYIDASVLKNQKIEKLSLNWQFQNQGNRLFYVKVSGSNDLSNWNTIKSRQKLLEVRSGNKTILENSIDLNHTQYLYYQLIFENSFIPEIKSIQAHLIAHFVNGNNQWNEVESYELYKDNSIQFDTGGFYPIDSIKLDFNQKNTLTDVSVYSRNNNNSKWQYAGNGSIYSILVDGSLNEKNTIKLRRSNNRFWKIVLDDHINNASVGSIEFGWRKHQIEFLAQGEAPFSLLFGNKEQTNQAPYNWFHKLPKEINFSDEVIISDAMVPALNLPSKQQPLVKSDNAKLIFWLILASVIILLVFMAYKLVNESKE